MKKVLLAIMVLVAALASCNKYEHNNDVDPKPFYIPKYQIGDYYQNDTLQGIVFATISGGINGLMVSLEEVQLPWCIPNYVNTERPQSLSRHPMEPQAQHLAAGVSASFPNHSEAMVCAIIH